MLCLPPGITGLDAIHARLQASRAEAFAIQNDKNDSVCNVLWVFSSVHRLYTLYCDALWDRMSARNYGVLIRLAL